jgi:hypothetical protein
VRDLAEFLLARIAEDEAVARAAAKDFLQDSGNSDWDGCTDAEWAWVTRWAPARVLAECEAKRQIVALHEDSHECSTYDHNGEIENCTWVLDGENCTTLRLLALPYVDHPDFRAEWR